MTKRLTADIESNNYLSITFNKTNGSVSTPHCSPFMALDRTTGSYKHSQPPPPWGVIVLNHWSASPTSKAIQLIRTAGMSRKLLACAVDSLEIRQTSNLGRDLASYIFTHRGWSLEKWIIFKDTGDSKGWQKLFQVSFERGVYFSTKSSAY